MQMGAHRRGHAPSPVFLCRPRAGPRSFRHPPQPRKYRGRAGRQGSGRIQVYAECANENARTRGPRCLAASGHAEVCTAFRQVRRKSAKTQGVPRAVFVRFAPLRPRWTYRFRHPSLCEDANAYPPLVGPGRKGEPATGSLNCPPAIAAGPGGARTARRDEAAWTAGRGKLRRISDAPDRPPLPAPRLETLDQTPLGTGRG